MDSYKNQLKNIHIYIYNFFQISSISFKYLKKYFLWKKFLCNTETAFTLVSRKLHEISVSLETGKTAGSFPLCVHKTSLNTQIPNESTIFSRSTANPLAQEGRLRIENSTKNRIYHLLTIIVLRFYDSHIGQGETEFHIRLHSKLPAVNRLSFVYTCRFNCKI